MTMIKQFMVGCSKTINLGNFQSIRLEAQVVVEVPEEETRDGYEAMTMNAQLELTRLLEETNTMQRKKRDDQY